MLTKNYESKSDKCFIGPIFVQTVVEHADWVYRDEGKDALRTKYGFISTKPGSVLKLKVGRRKRGIVARGWGLSPRVGPELDSLRRGLSEEC